MKYSFGGASSIGRRKENQDSFKIFYTKEKFLVSVVADGMGGHDGGSFASKLAVKFIENFFKSIKLVELSDKEIEKQLIFSIKKLHEKFKLSAIKKPELEDMGTTLNLNVFIKNNLYTINIGDSRSSQFISREIIQISLDHNLAFLARNDKNLDKFKGYTNYLTSSLGPKKETKLDIFLTKLNRKGYIIITTDGVHNFLSAGEIIKVLKNKNLNIDEKVETILRGAYQNNSNDNMTCVLVKYEN